MTVIEIEGGVRLRTDIAIKDFVDLMTKGPEVYAERIFVSVYVLSRKGNTGIQYVNVDKIIRFYEER